MCKINNTEWLCVKGSYLTGLALTTQIYIIRQKSVIVKKLMAGFYNQMNTSLYIMNYIIQAVKEILENANPERE